jgi:hypothetical protein
MADYRLFGEVGLVLDQGFVTSKKKQLDDLYKKYNVDFASEDAFRERIHAAMQMLVTDQRLGDPTLRRAHMVQSILAAIIGRTHGGAFLQQASDARPDIVERLEAAPVPMDALCSALREPEDNPGLSEFVAASSQKTNVDAQRIVRFLYLFYALGDAVADDAGN